MRLSLPCRHAFEATRQANTREVKNRILQSKNASSSVSFVPSFARPTVLHRHGASIPSKRKRHFSNSRFLNVVNSLSARNQADEDDSDKPKPPALSTFHASMCASFRAARIGDFIVAIERADEAVMRPDYCILHADGRIEQITEPVKKKQICLEFGLNPRDLRVLDGTAPSSFAPNLLVRDKSIVYSSSVLRAIITAEACHVFSATNQEDGRLKAREIVDLLKTTLGLKSSREAFYKDVSQLPFELRALESVLYRLTSGYRQAIRTIRDETNEMLLSLQEREVQENSMHEAIRDVSDARHCIEDFLLRARGLQTALASVLREDDSDLANMYLTAKWIDKKPRANNDHAEVELLLEGILRRQDETVHAAEGLLSQVLAAERALELGLDATRNSLMFLEIKLNIVIFGMTCVSAVYASFGMNLPSHMEDHHSAFYWTVFFTLIMGGLLVRGGMRALTRARRSRMRLLGRPNHQRLPQSTQELQKTHPRFQQTPFSGNMATQGEI